MNTSNQIHDNRRSFLKNAGLLSLTFTLPGLTALNPETARNAADSTIEIHTGNKLTVLIAVFTVQPENEQKLIDLFEEGTLSIFAKQPGYISASLHRGNDGNAS